MTEVVDTAGMDAFSKLSRSAMIGCHGYLLVFCITNLQSFHVIQEIHTILEESQGTAFC